MVIEDMLAYSNIMLTHRQFHQVTAVITELIATAL